MTRHRSTAEAWCALLASDSRYSSSFNPTPTESNKQNTHANNGQPSAREGGGLFFFFNQYVFFLEELMACPQHYFFLHFHMAALVPQLRFYKTLNFRFSFSHIK